jgi:beta-glucosidase
VEWDGFIESDYTASRSCSTTARRLAADAGRAGAQRRHRLRDGLDVHPRPRQELLAQRKISMARLDDAVRRILRVKFRAGLFEHPTSTSRRPRRRRSAGRLAARAQGRRPLDGAARERRQGRCRSTRARRPPSIGPLADNGKDMVGPWWGRGDDSKKVTVLEGIRPRARAPRTPRAASSRQRAAGLRRVGGLPEHRASRGGRPRQRGRPGRARASGESRAHSGEAASRRVLDLPGNQEGLIKAIKATGKPFGVVLFNGRPLTLDGRHRDRSAILESWFRGVEAGNAIADVVFGKVNPGGKLPVSFPRRVGQVPIYYNHEPTAVRATPRRSTTRAIATSRAATRSTCSATAQLQQVRDHEPAAVGTSGHSTGKIDASIDVKNVAARPVTRWCSSTSTTPWRASRSRSPAARVRARDARARRDEDRHVQDRQSDFGFYDNSGKFVVEPGRIDLFAGNSSKATMSKSFTVTGGG